MDKNIPNDVAQSVATTRENFFAAFEAVEEVRGEISSNDDRLEKVSQKLCERSERFETLKESSKDVIGEYEKELERIKSEKVLIMEAKDAKRKAQTNHEKWELELRNARTRRNRERIEKLEAQEPEKPESITIPELRPIDKHIEAKGLVAIHDLSVAMNDYTLAIAARRECKEREVELLALLDERERELIEARQEYEKDVNRAVAEYKSRERRAQEERRQTIATLKATRDAANAGLKKMGAE